MATVAPPKRERSLPNRFIDAMLSAAGSALESIERRRGMISSQMVFTVQIEEDEIDGGYVASCVELPGAMAQGETEEEAVENIIDVIPAVLEAKMQRHLKQSFAFAHVEAETSEIDDRNDEKKRPRRRAIEIPVT